jgi:hypothetical protein
LNTTNDFLNAVFGNNGDFQRFNKELDLNWVVNYWTSKLSTDDFNIKSIVAPDAQKYLVDSLSGIHQNIEVAQLICYFDRMRRSWSISRSRMRLL